MKQRTPKKTHTSTSITLGYIRKNIDLTDNQMADNLNKYGHSNLHNKPITRRQISALRRLYGIQKIKQKKIPTPLLETPKKPGFFDKILLFFSRLFRC